MNKILLIDDEQTTLSLYTEIITPLGYEILTVQSAEQGIEMAIQEKPDLIIMDWKLPGIDGITAAKAIKEKVKNRFVYILMATNQEGQEAAIDSIEYIDDYMEKTAGLEVLQAKIKKGFRAIQSYESQNSLYQQAYGELKRVCDQRYQLLLEKESLIDKLNEERENLKAKIHDRVDEINEKNKLLSEKNHEFLKELEIAARLQHNLLPQNSPLTDRYHMSSRYIPTAYIGGDFYDFLHMRENKLGVLLGDVSGHGIAAAFITSMIKTIVTNSRKHLAYPQSFFTNLNHNLFGRIYYHFVTASYAVFDLDRPSFVFSSAGHPPSFLYDKRKDEIIDLTAKGTILGAIDDITFGEREIELHSGDRLLFFTDGLLEVFNQNRDLYGINRLREDYKETCRMDGDKVFDYLIDKVKAYSGRKDFEDDVALVQVEVT